MSRILIFANGRLPDPGRASTLLKENDLIIAADGGTRHVLSLGRRPACVIGDLDSISGEELKILENGGIDIIQFPADKVQTDLELALGHALTLDPAQIVIVGGLGGRMDQTLGNIALLTDTRLSVLDVRFDDGVEEIFLCRDRVEIEGRSGDIVSLIPWGVEVSGILTENLRWPLNDEPLFHDKTRGISNEMLGEKAIIKIRSGILLIVHQRLS